jgi:hypothetical protein
MPEKTFQTNRHSRNRAHTAPLGALPGTQTQTITVRQVADWRNASSKAPDSLLPGVGSDFSNGDRRNWH